MARDDHTGGPRDGGRDYEVGFGKPPKHSRFRKGESGNPRGRARGRKNLKTEILEELATKVEVTENGHKRYLPKQTLIVKRLVADAAKGNARAREQLLKLIDVAESTATQEAAVDKVTAAKDAEILAHFRNTLIAELEGDKK